MSEQQVQTPFALLQRYAQMHERNKKSQVAKQEIDNNYLCFTASDQHYLVDVRDVEEVVNDIGTIVPLPFAPYWLLGLVGHRGEVFSVVDFRRFAEIKLTKQHRVGFEYYLLLKGVGRGYALKIDSVLGIYHLDIQKKSASSCDWIDGYTQMEEKEWLRIDVSRLVNNSVFVQQHV